jgi:hypothetical protein
MMFDIISIPRAVVIGGWLLGILFGIVIRPRLLMWLGHLPVKAKCPRCGGELSVCDDCAVKYRFRFVEWPPKVVMLSHEGAPHMENDCGSHCIKYVRAPE